MKRRLFSAFSACSLLLWIGAAVLWLRGYHEKLVYHVDTQSTVYGLRCDARFITFIKMGLLAEKAPVPDSRGDVPLDCGLGSILSRRIILDDIELSHDGGLFNRLGFGAIDLSAGADLDWLPLISHLAMVRVPQWFALTATALLPLLWLRRFARRPKRRTEGACAVCSYDLRATPERCPECGTPVLIK